MCMYTLFLFLLLLFCFVLLVLSVSCWNIRFGAISNFRVTNSGLSRPSEVTIFITDAFMLNPVREGEGD